MGIPLQQPSKPPAQDQAQQQPSNSTGNRQSDEREESESMIVEDGSRNGDSSSTESRLHDVAPSQGTPLGPDQQDIQGIGAWAHDEVQYAETLAEFDPRSP